MFRSFCVLLATAVISGCGFVFVHGPPADHATQPYFSCTESNAGPILDLVWAGLNIGGAIDAQNHPENYQSGATSVGIVWAVVSTTAAIVGFNKVKQCQAAKRELGQRLLQSAAPEAVTVTPAIDTLPVGSSLQLVATAHTSSGLPTTTGVFTWSSSNDSVATVNGAGLVAATAPGSVTIAARTGTAVGTASVVVVPRR